MGAVKNHFHDDLEARRCAEEGEVDLGPPALVWRDDPLFNQAHVAAELALAALLDLERRDADLFDETDGRHAVERLEAFLSAAREEAKSRAP